MVGTQMTKAQLLDELRKSRARIGALERRESNRKRAELTLSVLLTLSESTQTTGTLADLLHDIHDQVGTLIDATNFYVALYDDKKDVYSFPYVVDEEEESADFPPQALKRSLTDYVRRTGKPLLADERTHQALMRRGEVDLVGASSHVWLGVPLRTQGKVIGVVVVQSYKKRRLYTKKDLQLMTFVSDYIAAAIERKRVEKSLRLTQFSADQAADAAYWMGPDARFIYVNEAACRALGYTREELLTMTVHDIDPGFPQEVWAQHWEEVRRRRSFTIDTIHRTRDGRDFPVEVTVNYLQFEGCEYNCASARDVSERKQVESELARARRLEAAGQVAGQIAHDFNNLLGPLVAYPELIRPHLPEGSPVRRMMDTMEGCATQMSDINQQLLTLSRRGHFKTEPVDLNAVVDRTLSSLEIPPEVSIELRLDSDLFQVSGNFAQLQRVLSNLIMNAADAVDGAGTISIKTESRYLDQPLRRYSSIKTGEYVCATVTDTGHGISGEHLPKIFDPFFSTKTADQGRGTGLGLSVVHSVVEDHRGYIDVETGIGTGTTVSLYIPICRDARSVAENSDGLTKGQGEHILVVDDDATQREVMTEILRQLNYNVSTAPSGEDAIRLIADNPRDLVLLDMVMGGIDGAQTLQEIRRSNPDQRVILLSGFAATDRVALAMENGAAEFLSKPVSPSALSKAINRVIRGD